MKKLALVSFASSYLGCQNEEQGCRKTSGHPLSPRVSSGPPRNCITDRFTSFQRMWALIPLPVEQPLDCPSEVCGLWGGSWSLSGVIWPPKMLWHDPQNLGLLLCVAKEALQTWLSQETWAGGGDPGLLWWVLNAVTRSSWGRQDDPKRQRVTWWQGETACSDALLLPLNAKEGSHELKDIGGLWRPERARKRLSPESPWRTHPVNSC
jgi:hypothetical protein